MTEQEILDAVTEAPLPEKVVNLTTIRDKAKELRDHYLEKAYLEEQLKDLGAKIQHVERHELIDMFDAAGISSIAVDSSGNLPAFIAKRTTEYGAKIPDERRLEALNWFEAAGHGDLVKSVITIQFGMQEHEERLRVMKLLSENNVQYYTNESVHHMTLKAFVKREIIKGHIIPMDLLGVYVFDEVKIK
jgi:hypothetical protein